MPTALRNILHWLVYAGLALAAGAMMLLGKADAVLVERVRLQVNDVLVPMLDVLSRPVDATASGLQRLQDFTNVADENRRLRAEREQLLRWQAVAERLEAENAELRRLLHFVPDPQPHFVSARVVADSTGTFAHSFLLNAGSTAGAEKGQIVLTGEGLIGRVVGVSPRAARVLLLTDLNSRVPVLVGPARVRAVLAGDNTDRPKLIHAVPDVPIAVGDRVVTSGIAGAFPAGLAVGVVERIDDGPIRTRLFADRHRVEFVRVADFGLESGLDAKPATAQPWALSRDDRPKGRTGTDQPAVRADAR